eukprot:1162043-Pelagomonas_calceolata.AAC.5
MPVDADVGAAPVFTHSAAILHLLVQQCCAHHKRQLTFVYEDSCASWVYQHFFPESVRTTVNPSAAGAQGAGAAHCAEHRQQCHGDWARACVQEVVGQHRQRLPGMEILGSAGARPQQGRRLQRADSDYDTVVELGCEATAGQTLACADR